MTCANWFWPVAAFLFLISLLVALDAKKNRIPTTGDEYGLTTGACVWFLGCFLFIWVALPSYLCRRSSVLRWRTQRLTWDEGTNSCGDYVVRKEQDRILILVRSRWGVEQVFFIAGVFVFSLPGIGLLAIAIIDWFQGGASHVALVIASLFCEVLAVAFYGLARSELTQNRVPWILDRQADVFLKGDKPLRSLSSVRHLELTAFEFRGNRSWEVTFAPALKVQWWKRLFKGEPRDSFVFESEVAAWTFATELAGFLGVRLT